MTDRPLLILALTAAIGAAPPATADDVTDTLDAIRSAYDDGNIGAALEELSFLQAMLTDLRTESLAGFLPEPPDGWSRDVETEMSGFMAMAGGGAGATGTYSNDTESFTVTILADSPLVTAMGAMLTNPMIARAAGGDLKRIGDIKVLDMEGDLSALIDGRILVQAEGAPTETMMPVLEAIDFDALSAFKL